MRLSIHFKAKEKVKKLEQIPIVLEDYLRRIDTRLIRIGNVLEGIARNLADIEKAIRELKKS